MTTLQNVHHAAQLADLAIAVGGKNTKKHRKSRKSRKSRKFKKSRKLKLNKSGGYRTIVPGQSCPFKQGKLLSN